ncbi:hypothetical protein OH77DRAFT_922234 [Trametes cingulata]|nr:hypothetical protein OH77DRAFT_922234 [Trametes cingulata]
MDKLAFELLTEIVGLACDDGGYTACSLLQTCRHLHDAVRPIRFRSIALAPAPTARRSFMENVELFVACLQRERAALRGTGTASRVRHLFLSAVAPTRAPQAGPDAEPDPPPPAAAPDLALARSPVADLLRAVADEVETLTFIGFPGGGQHLYLGPLEFTALRELTIDDTVGDVLLWGDSHTAHPELPPVEYPVLERLHCYMGNAPFSLSGKTFPLTHLRLSECSSLYIGDTWTHLVNVTCRHDETWVFPSIEQIIVQPRPPPPSSPSPSDHAPNRFNYYITLLQTWAGLHSCPLPCYFLGPSEHVAPGRVEEPDEFQRRIAWQAKEHWLSRLRGGDGCWAVKPEQARRAQKGARPPVYLVPREFLSNFAE